MCQCVMKISAASILGSTRTCWKFHRLLYTRGGRNLYHSQPLFTEDFFQGCLISTLVSCISNWSGHSVSSQEQKDFTRRWVAQIRGVLKGSDAGRASKLPSTDSLLGEGNGWKLGKSILEKSRSTDGSLAMAALTVSISFTAHFSVACDQDLPTFPTDRWHEPNSYPEYVN